MARLTGRRLNAELTLGAQHALYHKDGYWYDQLRRFPGILFDRQGYVSFASRAAYLGCPQLRHPDRERSDGRAGTLSVPSGIASVPGYVRDDRIVAFEREP
jgi:5-methylcytosine-specific restriction enzyme A